MATSGTTVVVSKTRAALANIPLLALISVLVFWPAGTLAWLHGWLYVAVFTAAFAINFVYLVRVNPAMVDSRTRVHPGTKRWDIVWGITFGPLFCAIFIVAGFDVIRYGWTSMSPWFWLLGLALFVPGNAFLTWSMGVNPFFEKTVRIQTDRDQRVIDTGPYQYVRHPGYVGLSSWCISTPMLLGSWWAFVPAILAVASLCVRTALEDRTLRLELDGYATYTRQVRYRLVPGLW